MVWNCPRGQGHEHIPDTSASKKWTEAMRVMVMVAHQASSCSDIRVWLYCRGVELDWLRLFWGPGAVAHLFFGTCHLEAGTEVIQPFPLFMPPQALQVLPKHVNDLEEMGS